MRAIKSIVKFRIQLLRHLFLEWQWKGPVILTENVRRWYFMPGLISCSDLESPTTDMSERICIFYLLFGRHIIKSNIWAFCKMDIISLLI